ncbi:hypothetical protein LXA43DRAFT_893135, partial [Ganoderma leucocontextum]
YLDTKDAESSGNLFKHARLCWSNEAVDHALELGDTILCMRSWKPKAKSKSITEFFTQKNGKKMKYSHRALTWAVRWVAEDLRPFKMLGDHGFLVIAKSGCPGYYVPLPTMVSQDAKVIFVTTRKQLVKMLQGYPGKLRFTMDAWTSPNHQSFIAVTIHLKLKGRPLRMLLDLVELAKVCTALIQLSRVMPGANIIGQSHTGVNLAVSF